MTQTFELDGRTAHVVSIDGRQPITPESIDTINDLCDLIEDVSAASPAILHVTGVPDRGHRSALTVGALGKWERALRRLERLPAATIAVATADCGGQALEVLLATDYRIAHPAARLIVPLERGATWPGMALYRLAQHGAGGAVRRAVLFGAPIAMADAQALHIVHDVTDDLTGAVASATTLADTRGGPDLAIRRQLLFDASSSAFEEALGAHLAACDRALRSAVSDATT